MIIDRPNTDKITGFAGARFCPDDGTMVEKNEVRDPLHRLFETEMSEMFEEIENYTWISEN